MENKALPGDSSLINIIVIIMIGVAKIKPMLATRMSKNVLNISYILFPSVLRLIVDMNLFEILLTLLDLLPSLSPQILKTWLSKNREPSNGTHIVQTLLLTNHHKKISLGTQKVNKNI